MNTLLPLSNVVVLLLLSTLHLYWVLGGMWGHMVTIPTDLNGRKLFRPGALTIFSVAIMLLFFALVNLCLILPVLPMPVKYIRFPLIGIALMFLLRAVGDFNYLGFTKRFNKTLFAKLDYALISPLCLILGISHLIVAFLL